jgi:hypothetical protein
MATLAKPGIEILDELLPAADNVRRIKSRYK